MPNQMKIRFWLFRSLRNCSCLAFRPVGNSCHRPKVRMARSISSLIAKSDKQVSRSRTKARYAGPSVLTARLRSQIRIGKYAAAGSRKRPFRYQYHSFGGRISQKNVLPAPKTRFRVGNAAVLCGRDMPMLHMLHAPLVVNIMLRVAKNKIHIKIVYHNRIEKKRYL